jgi:hypothetical protein
MAATGLANVEAATDQTTPGDGNMKNVVFYDCLGRESETSRQAQTQRTSWH